MSFGGCSNLILLQPPKLFDILFSLFCSLFRKSLFVLNAS